MSRKKKRSCFSWTPPGKRSIAAGWSGTKHPGVRRRISERWTVWIFWQI